MYVDGLTYLPVIAVSLNEQGSSDTKGKTCSIKFFGQTLCQSVSRRLRYSINKPVGKGTTTECLCLKFWPKTLFGGLISILTSLTCHKIHGFTTALCLTSGITVPLSIPFCLYSHSSMKFHCLNYLHSLAKVVPNLLRGYKIIKPSRTWSHKPQDIIKKIYLHTISKWK